MQNYLVIGLSVFVILVGLALLASIFALVAYLLAQLQICFTTVKEGTAIAIVRGTTFDHFLMAYKGHCLNDPRRAWHTDTKPDWEVMDAPPGWNSAYNFLPWRLLERFGIYWYGLWPLYSIYVYKFEWSEGRINNQSQYAEPWHRIDPTQFVYVSAFPYWLKLPAAEDRDNMPLDLDYLQTMQVTNPYTALFTLTDWLTRLTADANNVGKVWVGARTFEDIVRERGSGGTATDEFVDMMRALNVNLPTAHATVGAPELIGVTILATSLISVAITGQNAEALATATTARVVAKRNAEATVETARGAARAVVLAAAAEKKREIKVAEGKQKAIELVYRKVEEFGEDGLLLQQLEAMRDAGVTGKTVIWANNPFIRDKGLANTLAGFGLSPAELLQAVSTFRSQQTPT